MLKKPLMTPTLPAHAGTCLSPSFVLASELRPRLRKDASWRVEVGRVSCLVFLNILRASSTSTIAIQFTSSTYSNGFSPVG